MRLLPILKQVEQRLHVLPHRQFKPASNDEQPTEKIQKIIIDATERPCCRPSSSQRFAAFATGPNGTLRMGLLVRGIGLL